MNYQIYQGDVLDVLRTMPDESVNCCVTSPPYWGGLRDYGDERQIGLERNPSEYIDRMVEVFRNVRRTLVPGGSLFLNTADAYAASGKGGGGCVAAKRKAWDTIKERKGFRMPPEGYKMKDLVLVSSALAEAIRADGWYLRATVIWAKPTAIEPVRLDRPSVSHEYIFQFSKSEECAVRDPKESWFYQSVWIIQPEMNPQHPAQMPVELARRCVVMSTEEGDTVIDPFCGAGTTGVAALLCGRRFIGVELNAQYIAESHERIDRSVGALFFQPWEDHLNDSCAPDCWHCHAGQQEHRRMNPEASA